ncbi:MAG: hypothetical protein LBR23_07300 [Spirochaetaceae bacterium]|jgi:hypothetical protein|nr:hypothetical protein [Spirochaetaceae bacterium]
MILAFVFLLIFFILLSAAYIGTFSMFLTALSEEGFVPEDALEAKTDYFRLYLGEKNTITFSGGDV